MATERLRQFATAAAAAAVSITRPNYFDTSKRGETYELRSELNSDLAIVRKEAVKKVIASMTTGKDVSTLFPDVLKNVQTDDMELKKLVYLYLMNYSKSQPELVILAINTFCKDSEDPNPLIRALAIRTMGCLRVDKVLDYLCEPLRKALQDENAYVRKTASICVAKVVELSPELAEENGFIEMLKGMLSDGNATVLANVIAALVDIHAHSPDLGAFQLDPRIVSRLIAALNDCTEWGQITILDALAFYNPSSVQEAIQLLEKITPRLQHVNTSLVLSAIKVIIVLMEYLGPDHEMSKILKRKLAPPLVSMVNSPPEIQFVALRNISLIIQRHPDILAQGVRVFFCKFNDPICVKLEKLKIILMLADNENHEQVMAELAEYAKEVDAEFAKESIIAIARCACKIDSTMPKAMGIFDHLLSTSTGLGWTIQAVAIALCIILRKDTEHGLELVEKLLLENDLSLFDEDEARASIAWLLGQYGHLLPVCEGILGSFLDDFSQEPSLVQSELLTASLKLFFQNSELYRTYLSKTIDFGKMSTENADLRERSILFERLLQIDPTLIQSLNWTNLGLLPPTINITRISEETLVQLLPQIGTVASVYQKLPAQYAIRTGLSLQKPPPMPDLLNLDTDGECKEDGDDGDDKSREEEGNFGSLPPIISPSSDILYSTEKSSPKNHIVDLLAD